MATRDRILDGAAEVMRSRGLARTTTKEIARAAGYSEATLYKIFDDKVDLFLAVLAERLPKMSIVRDGVGAYVGRDTVASNLVTIVTEAALFYSESFPIAASLFSDTELLTRHRVGVRSRGAGPESLAAAVVDYTSAEQREGRVAIAARPEAIAAALIGACLHRGFLRCFDGKGDTPDEARQFADELVETLSPALLADSTPRH